MATSNPQTHTSYMHTSRKQTAVTATCPLASVAFDAKAKRQEHYALLCNMQCPPSKQQGSSQYPMQRCNTHE